MSSKQFILLALVALLAGAVGHFLGRRATEDLKMSVTEMPSASAESDGSPTTDREILYWVAPMNAAEIYDKPGKSIMDMELVPVYADQVGPESSDLIRINPTTVQNMGVRSDEIHRMDLSRVIRTVGEVTFDEEKIYQVNARISGWIEKLYVNYVGAPVQKGDPLLEIYSPELVTTQEEYLLAFRQLEQAQRSGQDVSVRDAQRLLSSAKKRLENWEIPGEVIRNLEETGETSRTVLLRAPATGFVNEKFAVEGAHVSAGVDLFQLVDLSTVWVHASFYEDEVPWIKTGQAVEMELSYLPGKKYEGTVSYVYPFLREKARDVHVRLIFPNPNLDLKPGMYVNVQLQGKVIPDALVVPTEAIIRSGHRNIAFVVRGEGMFEPREIQIGEEGGPRNGFVRVLSGLSEGESVVVSAQFLLDSESRLQESIRKMLDMSSMVDTPDMPNMEE